MTVYHLYYAGMARDVGGTEQIGLARSTDGINFKRAHNDGLIVATDAKYDWRALRVCNPTVLEVSGKFLMIYQGISKRPPHHTAIGAGHSRDGMKFELAEEPCLSLEDMRCIDRKLDASRRIGLIEPSVLYENGRYRMWFVYARSYVEGNEIYYAESGDAVRWQIGERVMAGHQFGHFNIHYPQVIRVSSGYELWFTLRDNVTGVYGIFRMISQDGRDWGHLSQILPIAPNALQLGRRYLVNLSLMSRELRVSHALDRFASGWLTLRERFGFAHPHVLGGAVGDDRRMFLHSYHRSPRGDIWMDIGVCSIVDGAPGAVRRVLGPAAAPGGWDAHFVADPYVIMIQS